MDGLYVMDVQIFIIPRGLIPFSSSATMMLTFVVLGKIFW